MKKCRFSLLLLNTMFVVSGCQVSAQDTPDPNPPGVKVGEKAPDFDLVDQHGQRHALASLLKPDQTLAIVFHRSADW